MNKIFNAVKTMSSKDYWTRVNTVEAWGFATKIAIIFPGLSFFLNGKIISGVIALVLQIVAILTFLVFGLGFFIWLVLAIWAVVSNNNKKADARTKKILEEIRQK